MKWGVRRTPKQRGYQSFSGQRLPGTAEGATVLKKARSFSVLQPDRTLILRQESILLIKFLIWIYIREF